MSGPPRVRSLNCDDSESRPVLVPAGNNARSSEFQRPKGKVEKPLIVDKSKAKKTQTSPVTNSLPQSNLNVKSVLKKQQQRDPKVLKCNFSLNASCSSDASSDSSHSRASSGKFSRRSATPIRRKQPNFKPEKTDRDKAEKFVCEADSVSVGSSDSSSVKKRCAWVTPNTDNSYATFHDEEWGVPIHEDKKLFELLSLCTALAELTWPTILSKRHLFREVFQDFDVLAVSKFNEKKLITPGGPGSALLSELKLRAIIENARQVCKITEEIGSFDKYIWGFVNYKPIVGQFRYPRQVPIKSSKADAISKDLVKRGFRGVGPTVIYSFMQVAGLTNDHLVSCFRYQECLVAGDARSKDNVNPPKAVIDEKQSDDPLDLGLAMDVDALSLSMD